MDVATELGVNELRMRFLDFTRRTFARLPPLDRPRILDIGCGQGLQTMELARLSGGEVVGIDIDEAAVAQFRRRLEPTDLRERISLRTKSLFDPGLAEQSFDILWEEGVMHLLEPEMSFAACHRLLKTRGYLVMHETLDWFDATSERIPEWGFAIRDRCPLPTHYWWTDYGAPLERRIQHFRAEHGDAAASPELTRYANEAAMIREDPDRFDCGFFILQRNE
jgi:cyclopropane fatty-acyl-phospholipid synthase-like methyltransferase